MSSESESDSDIDHQPDDLRMISLRIHNQVRKVGVYKGIFLHELSNVIAVAFGEQISNSILGISPAYRQKGGILEVIPLSYVCNYPDSLEDATYTVILKTPRRPPPVKQWSKTQIALITLLVTTVMWAVVHALWDVSGPFRLAYTAISYLRTYVLHPLFRDVYRKGPNVSLLGTEFGFWGGAELSDICARITNSDGSFWKLNMDKCLEIYLSKETGFVYFVEFCFLAFSFVKISHFVLRRLISKIL
eukprot:186738_1